ncbi:hypothetical protein N8D56_21210 [Devosia sp. A8/3-2]|nr:hypothetical protein N8D56_21210 [Devosia sp. A8/3-2]
MNVKAPCRGPFSIGAIMTVPVPSYTEKSWAADGVTTSFAFQQRVDEAADIKVWLVEGEVATLQSQSTQYGLTGLGSPSGVSINFITPPAAIYTVTARRESVAKQTIDFTDLGKVLSETTEGQLDRLTMAIRDVTGRIDQFEEITDAAALIKDFDKRYTGAFSLDPLTDNKGEPLLVGALYFNTVLGKFKSWDGAVWIEQTVALNNGDVTEPKHATGGVSTRALADGSVINAKLAEGSVDGSKLAESSVDSSKIDESDAEAIRTTIDVNRDGKDGVFVTENIGHRMGLLQYRFDGSRGVILTPWKERWLPALHDCLHPNLLPVGVTARYVRPTGNNANSGADWANAVASLRAAVGLTGNIVFAEGGLKYKLSNLMGTTAINKDSVITFVGQPGLCIPSEDVTWTSVGFSVYQSSALSAPPIAVYAGVSLDTYGELPRYTEVTSQAEVAGMPASWAPGAGNTVYVRTGTGVAPTNATVHVCPSYSHRSDGGTGRLHINNAIMVGGFGVRNGLGWITAVG